MFTQKVQTLQILLFTMAALTAAGLNAQPRSKQIHPENVETKTLNNEAAAESSWKNERVSVDRDTCIMAVMHHARKIDQGLLQTEFYLRATIGQTPRYAIVEWVEKPRLNRNGAKAKVEEALRTLRAARKEISALAGKNGESYSMATIAAQNRCEEGLELGKIEKALGDTQVQVQSLFDNGYLEMKETNFEGFSETFLSTLFEAQQEVENLGTAVTTKPQRRLLGLFGTKNPHEKSKDKIENLEKKLRKEFPSAFTEGRPVTGSDRAKQMLAVNAAIVEFLNGNEIGYSDAAHFWKSGIVRDINSNASPKASAAYVDDLIINKIAR